MRGSRRPTLRLFGGLTLLALGLLALAGALALAAGPVAAPAVASASARPSTTPQTVLKDPALASDSGIHKIKHVVIIMQENHSFDNYFGTYPGADGIPGLAGNPGAVPCIPDPDRGHCDEPYHETYVSGSGGPHFNASAISDIDGGKMDGFARTAEQTGAGGLDTDKLGCVAELQTDCLDVMGYYNQQEIPNYWTYAKDFVLQDHMFEPVLAWSEVSHLYMVSGWSAQCASSSPESCKTDIQFPELPPGAIGDNALAQELTGAALGIALPVNATVDYAWTDITYLLHRYGVSWRYYVEEGTEPDCETGAMVCLPTPQAVTAPSIWNPLPAFGDVRTDGQLGNIQSTNDFFSDAAKGNLPAVSWVIPSGDDSEHAPANIEAGQDHVTSVINAIMRSKDWDSTAIFLAWDDWGGYYDNVDPPKVDAEGYGLRVPGLVISPYAKRGYVDHQTLSFDAYLKFIEDDFLGGVRIGPDDGRPDSRPDVRENAPQLGNLLSDFDFHQAPRAPVILNPNPFGKVNLIGAAKIGTTGTNPLTPHPLCPRDTGTLGASSVGPVRLGVSRAAQRRALPHSYPTRNHAFDDVCLASGHAIRVGYLSGHGAVLAMTANTAFSHDGFTPGDRLSVGTRDPGIAINRGRYAWFAIRQPHATFLIKALDGSVQEIGLASASLTRTRAATVALLAQLHA